MLADAPGDALRFWRLTRRKLSDLKLPADSPRQEFGDVAGLGQSIAENGLLVPLLIEPDGTVRGGSRRLQALRTCAGNEAGAEIECLVLPPGTDPAVAQLVENIQRKDLTPVEEAKAYRALLHATGWRPSRLARKLGIPPSRVSRSLNLLDAPPEVRAKVESGEANAWAVADAFGRKGKLDGRAMRVAKRLKTGGKVMARHAPASVRVPASELPSNIRAKVFADRVEITVTLGNDSPGLRGMSRPSEEVRAAIAATEGVMVAALRAARRKVLELDGFFEG